MKHPMTNVIVYKPGHNKPAKSKQKINLPLYRNSKHLILSLALGGGEYQLLATLLINSLRNIGNYSGDIVVITDTKDIKYDNAITIYKNNCSLNNKQDIRRYKLVAHLDIPNLEQYDKIMFCDADVICVSDVNKMFEYIDTNDIYCVTVHQPMYLKYSIREERAEISKYQLCATGHFGGYTHVYKKKLRLWNHYTKQSFAICKQMNIEEVMNRLIFNNLINYRLYPEYWVETTACLFHNRDILREEDIHKICLLHILDRHKLRLAKNIFNYLYGGSSLVKVLRDLWHVKI